MQVKYDMFRLLFTCLFFSYRNYPNINWAAKVQQKMDICNKIARKFTFKCDFVATGLQSATIVWTKQKLATCGGGEWRVWKSLNHE